MRNLFRVLVQSVDHPRKKFSLTGVTKVKDKHKIIDSVRW